MQIVFFVLGAVVVLSALLSYVTSHPVDLAVAVPETQVASVSQSGTPFVAEGMLVLDDTGGGTGVPFLVYEAEIVTESPTPEAPGPIGSFSIYTNGEHGFVVSYPRDARIEDMFSSQYHAGTAWRSNALAHATGTPLVAFIVTDIENEFSFPRYYTAQVRIGVSDHPDEIEQCEQAQLEQGEVALPEIVINGERFSTFSFADAGMMQYVKGVSYRTLRDNRCYAIERIASGSSYRESVSENDLTEEELEAQFEALIPIVESIQFVDQDIP